MKLGELIGLIVVVLLALLGVVLIFVGDIQLEGPPIEDRFDTPEEAAVYVAVEAEFGSWAVPRAPEGLPLEEESLQFGSRVWRTQCVQCHGSTGKADTPTASGLRPRPRDLRFGVLKYTSTEAGWPATRTDILRTITRGIPNTGMSSFSGIPEMDRTALAEWTMYLLIRGQIHTEALARVRAEPELTAEAAVAEGLEAARTHWGQAADHIIRVPSRPTNDARAIQRGEELFRGAGGCVACHSQDGSGLPEGMPALKDIWGQDVSPRDLRKGDIHGPDWQTDLFRRLHAGIKGTPMPGVGEVLTDDQIWDLVTYVESLKR